MATSTSANSVGDMLFACTNCHKRCNFEELSSSQQLCKECRKQYPLVTCTYCQLEFHPIKNSTDKDSRPACDRCARDFKQYGTPSFCITCNLQSAFNGKQCSRCAHSEKKYGPPVACEQCKLTCAFQKPDEARQKVDGMTLCLLCTINYKKLQFKKKSREQRVSKHSSSSSQSSKQGHHYKHKRTNDGKSEVKRLKLDVDPLLPLTSQITPALHSSLLGRDTQPLDILTTNHMLETDKLQNEISSLKKQLAQKDQALREKDKQICQLKAETLEKEKDFRTKLSTQQRANNEVVENLQAEIRTMRKQLSQVSQKKSVSVYQTQNSSLASLASSLAPNGSVVTTSNNKED